MPVRYIDADTLGSWLRHNKKVHILDIRPASQRADWFIPGSIHKDVYEKVKNGEYEGLSHLPLDKTTPLVTVCTAGKVSQKAAEMLADNGYDAYSLTNGMRGWSFAWDTADVRFHDFTVTQVRRVGKGCLSYIIASAGQAIVIDASLPVEVYDGLIKKNGWHLKAVIDTHVHADHLSRSRMLAISNNTTLYLPSSSLVEYPFTALSPNEQIPLGSISLKILPTPGHTLESVSILAGNEVLFTGDTLFTDSIGRPDLKASDEQLKLKIELLHESLQHVLTLNENILVLPAHTGRMINFGDKIVAATIKEVKEHVSILRLPREKFVETVANKTPPTPENYLQIVERNLSGEFDEADALSLEAGANRCSI